MVSFLIHSQTYMLLIQGKNSSNENIIKKKYNNKEMLDPDGSFHTKKKKKL